MHQHAAAPWSDEFSEPQPELRTAFEALGFRVLGAAVRVLPTDAELDRLCAGFAEGDRDVLREWGGRPNQVLGAPDGTAFVRLAWFWFGTYAEVSTVLADGRVVTTALDWKVDPPWPRQIRRWYSATTDSRREQLLWSAPSASVVIVDDTPTGLWHSHVRHVAAVAGDTAGPRSHAALEDAVALYDATQASRLRSARRVRLVTGLCALALVLAPLWVLLVMLDPGMIGASALALAAWGVCLVISKQVWLRVRHWRWLHRPLRVARRHDG